MLILLAQTDRDSTTIFTTALESAGHDVLATDSGEQAIRLALERRPDVIVTELVLPMVDGWQVRNVLSTCGPLRTTPIMALTSYVEPEGRQKALGAGFAGYLTLPIEPMALVEAVERIAGARREPSAVPPARAVRRSRRASRSREASE